MLHELAEGARHGDAARYRELADFAPVDAAALLERVAKLPLLQWRFKAEDSGVKHIGPMAQDFRAAFGLGGSSTSIATVDADGVALAAIQGLNQLVREKDAELQELKRSVLELKAQLNRLSTTQGIAPAQRSRE